MKKNTAAKNALEKHAGSALETEHIPAEHVQGLQRIGREIIELHVKTGDKYLELCRFIREKQIAPRLVSHELAELGFNKVRIAEVNKISQCPNELWDELVARTISFKNALDVARGHVRQLLEVNPDEVLASAKSEGATQVIADAAKEIRREAGETVEETEEKTDAQKREAKEMAMAFAAKTLLGAAAFLKLKQKTFNINNGYQVIVKKAPKKVVKTSNDSAPKGENK